MHQPVADCRGGAAGAIVSIVSMARMGVIPYFGRADDSWLDAAKSRLPMGEMGQVDEIARIPSRDRSQADFVVFLLSDAAAIVRAALLIHVHGS
jgi:hypothetical protein